ncbi:hypothetical protein CEXT_671131 [Caerostris extrusa]|uniref:Uncharacterized protein n=1 Tax=Caerostris extrusa TaxID=172846 RepID=A0AAV4PE69_CAEEX|nr:hypothetical protein CEXT_671131 [Caerostris extrusa]
MIKNLKYHRNVKQQIAGKTLNKKHSANFIKLHIFSGKKFLLSFRTKPLNGPVRNSFSWNRKPFRLTTPAEDVGEKDISRVDKETPIGLLAAYRLSGFLSSRSLLLPQVDLLSVLHI